MRIGIVLSKTPNYSETFLVSKLTGLLKNGFNIVVFAQVKEPTFSLCEVRLSPSIPNLKIFQILKLCYVLLELFIKYPRRCLKFIHLERQSHKSLVQIAKNLYNNSHLLKSKLDWLHFGFATIAVQSENVANAIGAKMAISFRGFDLEIYPNHNPNCYSMVFKNVDKVHSISKYLLNKGYELGLSNKKEFEIIPPAIDVLKFKNECINYAEPYQFLTVARLHWIKGLEDSIKAMNIIKRKGVKFSYSVIGEGEEYEKLSSLIKSLNLSDCVFLEGKKNQDEVINFMKKSQFYIQYSISEGFCNAVLEAQSMGMICIVSNGGALSENVLQGKTGWVIPKSNYLLLAETILKIIELPNHKLEQISKNAKRRVIENFNLENQSIEFLKFYQ